MKQSCGIYELKNRHDRVFYKIFTGIEELRLYLKKHRDKVCKKMSPVYSVNEYHTYPDSEIRRLTAGEAERYLAERIMELKG